MTKEAVSQRDAQGAERAIKQSASRPRHIAALDSHLLLITDPQTDQAPEVAHEPLALMLWISHDDRLGQHAIEVRR
jgi:hypothetical protein